MSAFSDSYDPSSGGRTPSGVDMRPGGLWSATAYVWCGQYEGPALVPWTDATPAIAARTRRCEVRRAFAYAFRGILQVPRTISHGACDGEPRVSVRVCRSRGVSDSCAQSLRDFSLCEAHRAQLEGDDGRIRAGGWPSQLVGYEETATRGTDRKATASPLRSPRDMGRLEP